MTKSEISTTYNRRWLAPEFGGVPTEQMPKKIAGMILSECIFGDAIARNFTISESLVGGENMTLTHECINPNCQAVQKVWQKLTRTVVDSPVEAVA